MRILARIQHMSEQSILRMIPYDIYSDIKSKDPSPVFRAYVVGHEGESVGSLVGIGKVLKRWYKSAIRAINEKLQFGTKIFHEHVESNRHEGRSVIGEVVGKGIENIRNRLSSIAVAYIYPSFVNLPLDVASIEADLWIDPDEKGFSDIDVKNISGIALGNSRTNAPGFPGATLIGELQAFYQSSQYNDRGGNMEITLSDVKAFIRAEGLSPSDLFGFGTLMKDENVADEMKKLEKEAVTGEYKHRKRDEEGFDKAREKLEKSLEEKDTEIKKLNLKIITKSKAKDDFDKLIVERKIDGKKKEFIEKRFGKNFELADEEKMKDELDKFVDSQIDEFNETAKLLGVEIKEEKKDDEEDEDKDKGGSPDKKKNDAKIDDRLNPETNPFIPEA